MLRWLQDQILTFIQRRCTHPGDMVAVDILEGCGYGVEIRYCRRCGAVKPYWEPITNSQHREWEWRTPLPNLWRGK